MLVAPPKRIHTALRIPQDALAQIDQLAQAHRLTRTEYMVRCSLGEPPNGDSTDQRLDQHEHRLQRLEELAYNS